MALEVKLTAQEVPKKTRWGTIKKSLNQHIVHVRNPETGKFIHAGYVGKTSFLPIAGFPAELVEEVATSCSKSLNREVLATEPPPTLDQVAMMLATASQGDGDE